MGVTTDGELSYGIQFDDYTVFPWDEPPFDGDMDEWWRSVRGYTNPIEDPFDDQGNYKPGLNSASEQVEEYFANRRAWESENPIPVELVNYCSDDSPEYIIASKRITANRGYPEKLNLVALEAEVPRLRHTLMTFLEEFGIETDEEPGWLLSSYWG